MYKGNSMTNNRMFSIITISCFVSVIFIPIGIVLMLFYTDWNKTLKNILMPVLTLVYVGLITLVLNVQPANNKKGVVVPGSVSVGSTEFENNSITKKGDSDDFDAQNFSLKTGDSESTSEGVQYPVKVNNKKSKASGRWIYTVLFILFMVLIIVAQNLKSRKNDGYENPYVDTKQYKFPLNKDSKFPTVHFLKTERQEGEKFLFATPGKYNVYEGDILISNKRFVFEGKDKSDTMEFKIGELDTAVSVSSTCFMLTRGEKKFYFFIDGTQMKFVLNVLRYAAEFGLQLN